MLRAVTNIYLESQAFELLSAHRRDVFKVFRCSAHGAAPASAPTGQTVLSSTTSAAPVSPGPPPSGPPRGKPPAGPPPPARRSWGVPAAALALTVSVGGVYFYRKLSEKEKTELDTPEKKVSPVVEEEGELYPASGAELPTRVDFLLVGGGTASFAALRALRAARPTASLLVAGAERAPPYMRPPLSKELWRETDLHEKARQPETLTFRQWNGKRRSVIYEPVSFYAPMSKIAAGGGGVALARGWRVQRLHVDRKQATLAAPGQEPVTVEYDKCLIATGSVAKRLEALAPAAAAGRSLTVHSVRDVGRVAEALQRPAVRTVAIVGGGLLATELAAAFADKLRETGASVVQVYRERAPLQDVLPHYLARDAARRLAAAGVALMPACEIESSSMSGDRVVMRIRPSEEAAASEDEPADQLAPQPGVLEADVVVECVGAEPETALAEEAGLELHPELGGIVVNAELQARSGVWAAGDAACFHDAALGRRRVTHHDHAVLSGRRAAENMAADHAAMPRAYTHQSMFWSDLGPELGYEAIGIVDARLPTVAVFSADAVTDASTSRALKAQAGSDITPELTKEGDVTTLPALQASNVKAQEGGASIAAASASETAVAVATGVTSASELANKQYEKGVVFYMREKRVVGILLWNLFNRMHIARQVLAVGEFDDLFEVAKLFAPQDED